MKKEEIKKDVILEKILSFIDYLTNNIRSTMMYFTIFVFVVILFIIYNNNTDKKILSYNSYSSNNQNNYIDGNEDLSLIGFKNMIETYDESESYNQAFIYLLADALDNKDYDKINLLINDNKFSTDDNLIQSYYENIISNYYFDIGDNSNAIKYCKNAINSTLIEEHKNKFLINLLFLHLNNNDYEEAESVLKTLNYDDLTYDLKNKYSDVKSKLKYLSN